MSEQYLFHVGQNRSEPRLFDVKDAGESSVTLDLSGVVAGLNHAIAFVAKGRGVGQWRAVRGRADGGQIRLDRPWRVRPDESSRVLVQSAVRHATFYDNYINPSPDPAAIPDEGTRPPGCFSTISPSTR